MEGGGVQKSYGLKWYENQKNQKPSELSISWFSYQMVKNTKASHTIGTKTRSPNKAIPAGIFKIPEKFSYGCLTPQEWLWNHSEGFCSD